MATASPKNTKAAKLAGDLTPVTIGEKKPVELRPLFVLDGVEYSIPAVVDPRIALDYAQNLNDGMDPNIAALGLLKEMVGEENYAVLNDRERVGAEDFNAVLNLVQEMSLGQAEAVKN